MGPTSGTSRTEHLETAASAQDVGRRRQQGCHDRARNRCLCHSSRAVHGERVRARHQGECVGVASHGDSLGAGAPEHPSRGSHQGRPWGQVQRFEGRLRQYPIVRPASALAADAACESASISPTAVCWWPRSYLQSLPLDATERWSGHGLSHMPRSRECGVWETSTSTLAATS